MERTLLALLPLLALLALLTLLAHKLAVLRPIVKPTIKSGIVFPSVILIFWL